MMENRYATGALHTQIDQARNGDEAQTIGEIPPPACRRDTSTHRE